MIEITKPMHRIKNTNLKVPSGNPRGSAIIDTSSRITNPVAA